MRTQQTMKPFLSASCAAVVGLGLFFASASSAWATIDVQSSASFSDLTISAAAGTVNFTSPIQTTAYGQAGGNTQYSAATPSSVTATDVPVPGGSATGMGSASLPMAGSGNATGFIPGAVAGFDTSEGQGSVGGIFEITGVAQPVNVVFSAAVSSSLDLFADDYGVKGRGESIFSLSIDGSTPLFIDTLLTVGPDQEASQNISTNLAGSMMLMPNTPYYLFAQADAEADVVNAGAPASVPDSMGGGVMAGALAITVLSLFLLRRRTVVSVVLLAGAAISTQAMYIGSDAPDICKTCGAKPTRVQAGAISTSVTEGNIREDYPVVTLTSGYGPTMAFALTYNSYTADGSKAQLDTGLGFGWTHIYNSLLFMQRGQMFRLGNDGRVTQYARDYSGTGMNYVSANGYFETMTMQTDGTFYVTNKNKSWWHYGLVANTPFFIEGPVYRLLQLGDRNQNVTTMTYNSGGLLTTATDTYGRTVQFTYNSSNHLTSVIDPLGRTTTFTYDAQNRVPVTITDPLGRTVQYTYNSQYQITRKVDRDGRMYFYTYKDLLPYMITDGSGLPYFSMTNPADWSVNSTTLASNMMRQYIPSTTTSTDGRGNKWQYQYDANGYILETIAPDGATTKYTYDPNALEISSMTDPNGNVTRYQYDAMGNRTNMTDALGDVTTYTYDPVFNQITSMTDPLGRTTTWTYDANGNKIQETDPLLETRSWTYDAHGNVLTYMDKNGYTTTNVYDSQGELISVTDPLGYTTTFTYDAVGNIISTVDPLGRTTQYQYDALDRMIGMTNALGGVTTYTYDGVGHQLSVTDPNTNTTQYIYDQRARMIQVTDALGHATRYGYDANDNRIELTNQLGHVTSYGYDVQNRQTAMTNPVAGITTYTYDPVGNRITSTDPNTNVTQYHYDALNRVTRMTDAIGGTTTYDYSMPGGPPCCSPTPGSSLVTEMIDADGNITFYHYDELNRRVQVLRKNSDTNNVINPADAVTTTTYDADNNVTSITDPNTNTTTYFYDADDRQISMIDAVGDTTLTSYDADGNVIATTAPNLNITTNSYDALNRVISAYDAIGPITTTTYDPDGNVLSVTDGVGNTTQYHYDALNRQIQVIDPLGSSSTTAYDADGNVISMTDRNGHTTTNAYDAMDRRTSVIDALGDTTIFTYDPDNNVVGMTDANGRTTTYTYDALNRQITETYPDALPNTRSNFYDGVGNLIERIDQEGRTTTYSYNDLYYLTNRAYLPSGTNDAFIYDNGGRMLRGIRNGWTDSYRYDGANRLTNAVQNGRIITYIYDIPGRTQTNTYPSGRIINYAYDARSRLSLLNDTTPNPAITTYAYDDADRVVTHAYRNGMTGSYTYDADSRVVTLTHSNTTSLVAGFSYTYDYEGNRLDEQKLHAPSDSETYTYDAINRLTNYDVGTLSGPSIPSPTMAKSWILDAVGNWNNLISNSVPDLRTYGPADELLTDNGSNYTYDADGNLLRDNTYAYAYDEENRLIQVERLADSAITGQYVYDATGRLVERIEDPAGSPVTNFYYYDNMRIIEEQDATGATLATYTYGISIDEVLTMDRAGHSYYYHPNSLGSTAALTDSSANPVERYYYDAYGAVTMLDGSFNPLPGNSWGTVHSAVTNRFLFTGRELNEESGLYYYRMRHMDSVKGRFLQRDPQDYLDGVNQYEYVDDAPINKTDPSGLGPNPLTASPGDIGARGFDYAYGLALAYYAAVKGEQDLKAECQERNREEYVRLFREWYNGLDKNNKVILDHYMKWFNRMPTAAEGFTAKPFVPPSSPRYVIKEQEWVWPWYSKPFCKVWLYCVDTKTNKTMPFKGEGGGQTFYKKRYLPGMFSRGYYSND